MITASVLADQNAGGAQAPEFKATTRGSDARVVFDPGAQGYQDGHHYVINSRTSGTRLNDAMGTTLHELTHVANGEVYQNTDNLISAETGSTPQQLHNRREQRVQALLGIQKAGPTAKIKSIADQEGGIQSLAKYSKGRLEYAGGNKLGLYLARKADALTARATKAYQAKKGTSGRLAYKSRALCKNDGRFGQRTLDRVLLNYNAGWTAATTPRLHELTASLHRFPKIICRSATSPKAQSRCFLPKISPF